MTALTVDRLHPGPDRGVSAATTGTDARNTHDSLHSAQIPVISGAVLEQVVESSWCRHDHMGSTT